MKSVIKIKVIFLLVILALIFCLSSCSITETNNGFHIGKAFRNNGVGGCGAWFQGRTFKRR